MRNINSIEKFVKNKNGKITYKSWLNKYLEVVKANDETYFKTKHNYDADIIKFAEKINHWAPSTMKASISCIKTFFMFNNVRLQPKTEYQLKELCKGPKAVNQEQVPDQSDLKKILSFGNIKHKALFLTMASSGMRPGEAVKITLNDVYLDETPARIEIPYDITKIQESRNTFISSEAKECIKQWLRIKDKYLKSANSRSTLYPKIEDDKRLFPFSHANLYEMWVGLLEKAGYDALDEKNGHNKKRHKMTPHKLRKFFKTSLSNAGVPFEVVEALMGHREGVSVIYRRYTTDQLKQWYLKGEENLLIFERPANQDDIDNLKNQMEMMQSQLQQLIGKTDWAKQQTEDVLTIDKPYGHKEKIVSKIEMSNKELLERYQEEQKDLEEMRKEGQTKWSETTLVKQ